MNCYDLFGEEAVAPTLCKICKMKEVHLSHKMGIAVCPQMLGVLAQLDDELLSDVLSTKKADSMMFAALCVAARLIDISGDKHLHNVFVYVADKIGVDTMEIIEGLF